MANTLLRAGADIAPAVGEAAAAEFDAFCEVYGRLPELDRILNGDETKSAEVPWPDEPSARYALTLSLAQRGSEAEQALNGFRWLSVRAAPEWVQLYAADVSWRLRSLGRLGVLASLSRGEPEFSRFVSEYAGLSGHGAPAS
jgi:hypothetical protein